MRFRYKSENDKHLVSDSKGEWPESECDSKEEAEAMVKQREEFSTTADKLAAKPSFAKHK